jgi:hypothetical protein
VAAPQVLGALEGRAAAAGFSVERTYVGGHEALVARRSDFRWRWMATRLHTFVVAFPVPYLDANFAEAMTSAAQQYAIDHKGGLPRGLQTGTATIAVFVSDADVAAVRPWFDQNPTPRYAAARFPVLVELGTGTVTYFKGRLRFGAIYSPHLHRVVEDVIVPAVGRS